MSEEKTYSIALRVQRTTIEDAYVAVPVTAEITKKREDGTFGIDADAFFAAAIRLSQDPRVEWKVESSKSAPHPEQRSAPDDRRSLDGYEGP